MAQADQWQRRLREEASVWGIQVSPEAAARLWRHWQQVKTARQVMRCTAVVDDQVALAVHYLDSLAPLALPGAWRDSGILVDVGSGAGFPGVPLLSVLSPRWSGLLVESHRRKASFLQWATHGLGLKTVQVVAQRVEDVGRDPRWRGRADAVTVRAVASLDVVAEYGLPLLRVGGVLWVYKGPGAQDEVDRYQWVVARLGGRISQLWPYQLPGGAGQRVLIQVQKREETPEAFPRRAGVPERRPLGGEGRGHGGGCPREEGEGGHLVDGSARGKGDVWP